MEYISNLLEEFIGRYNFNTVYKEQNFPFYKKDSSHVIFNMLSPAKAINILKASSEKGNNSIGFFKQTPDIPLINYHLSNALILITFSTHYIYMPTIFVKSIEDLTKSLSFAYNTSKKHRLPINIIISNELEVNLTTSKLYIENVEFIKPTPNESKKDSITSLIDSLKNANEDFKNYYNHNGDNQIDLLSLNNARGTFIDYLIPWMQTPYKERLKDTGAISILEDEEEFIKRLCYQFDIDVQLNTTNLPESVKTMDMLCPGCPFLVLFKKDKLQCNNIYTNINCNTIKRIFQVKEGNLIDFIGLTLEQKENNDYYVSNLSDFEAAYASKNVIYLNNFTPEEEKIFFNNIKHNRDIITFNYSCNNIPKSKPSKVILRRCKCIKEHKFPVCIQETLCPAIFIKGETVQINDKYCVDCKACKIVCPYRAIK